MSFCFPARTVSLELVFDSSGPIGTERGRDIFCRTRGPSPIFFAKIVSTLVKRVNPHAVEAFPRTPSTMLLAL